MIDEKEGLLSPYRVLDLAGETALMAGKILGELGADVIKIERPGGDLARNNGPFYQDEPHPEKSLFWFALNSSKRGITLNIETADGREIFKKLVEGADFVIESNVPGYMNNIGLGYRDLENINPGIILVSITPYGQSGPYKDRKTSDIVAWAMSGHMAPYGDADRPPIRISHHSQAYLHAGADGAMGAVTALYQRQISGEGQQIDVSIQEAAVHSSIHHNPVWNKERPEPKRGSTGMPGSGHTTTQLWPCKDGYVSFSHGGGSRLAPSRPLIKWMDSEGMADDFLRDYNWERPDFMRIPQDEMDRLEEPTARFFMSLTKSELLEGAVKYGVMLYPVSTTADMLENVQLKAREFWVDIEHPELDTTIIYPGAFSIFSEMSPRISRRAPLIGEHNSEIYETELGMSKKELAALKQNGTI